MQLALGFLAVLAVAGIAVVAQKDQVDSAAIERAAAQAETESNTSHVRGKAFDRMVIIWLENTDDSLALNDRESLLFHRGVQMLIASSKSSVLGQ